MQQTSACGGGGSTSNEFAEFTRKQTQHYQKMFKHYDADRDKFIDVEDLRKMSKKLGLSDELASDPVAMIREVDEDGDGKMSPREFMLIFHKAYNGTLRHPGLAEIYRQMYIADGDQQERSNPALNDFKQQIDEWSHTEEGTKI